MNALPELEPGTAGLFGRHISNFIHLSILTHSKFHLIIHIIMFYISNSIFINYSNMNGESLHYLIITT